MSAIDKKEIEVDRWRNDETDLQSSCLIDSKN